MNTIEQVFGTNEQSIVGQPKKELGQEDFLKLMIAQLQNQDPNNPADNGEFLSQIAQFSMVSGIDDLGTSFDGVAGSLYTSQAMQAAQLVGRQVLIEMDTATHLAGDNVDGVLALTDATTNMKIQIKNEAGELINSIAMDDSSAGLHKFSWDGLDEEGNEVPSGKYEITAEGLIEGELQGLSLHLYSNVESVSVDRATAGAILHLDNGDSVGFSQIREYR